MATRSSQSGTRRTKGHNRNQHLPIPASAYNQQANSSTAMYPPAHVPSTIETAISPWCSPENTLLINVKGPQPASFEIHSTLLCHRSAYFKHLVELTREKTDWVASSMRTTSSGHQVHVKLPPAMFVISLPKNLHINPDAFSLFVHFLYYDKVSNAPPRSLSPENLCQVWVLASKIGCSPLQEMVVDALTRLYAQRPAQLVVDPDLVRYVYGNTAAGCVLRRVLVEQSGLNLDAAWYRKNGTRCPREFLVDVCCGLKGFQLK